MRKPSRFFNFQMPYTMYEKLEMISKESDCAVAEVVRQAISLLLNEINATKGNITKY